MKDGAVVANAGHFDVELDLAALRELAPNARRIRPSLDEHTLADGRRIYLVAEGRLANLAAAEGHPADVMDLSFADQALSAEHVLLAGRTLPIAVHPVPPAIDLEVTRLKLAALGVEIDVLTAAQRRVPRRLARRHLITGRKYIQGIAERDARARVPRVRRIPASGSTNTSS
jgi:adenosylhomocysteinase